MKPDYLSSLEDAAMEVQERARQLYARESTDFLGRMGEALMEAEGHCPDGEMNPNDAEEYRESMIELAALATAQAAMASKVKP